MSNPLFVVVNVTQTFDSFGNWVRNSVPDTRQSSSTPGGAANTGIHHRAGTIQTGYERRDVGNAVWRRIRTNAVWFLATRRVSPQENRVWMIPANNIQPRVQRTTRQAVNVRRGPGTAYGIVRTLARNVRVTPTHRCTPASSLRISNISGAWVRIASREWVHESTAF